MRLTESQGVLQSRPTRRRLLALWLALLGLPACQEVGAPGEGGGVRLVLRVANAVGGETVDVTPFYRRGDQSEIDLPGAVRVSLDAGNSQTIAVAVEIAPCLADAAREPGSGCPLRARVVLRNQQQELLDSLDVGPFTAVPGSSPSVPVSPAGVAVIGPEGGTVRTPDGAALLLIPPGALSSETTIGIRARAVYPEDPRIAPGTVYTLTPSGLQFSQPVRLQLSYTTATVPGGAAREANLKLARLNAEVQWIADLAALADVQQNEVTGRIGGFSTYGLLVATNRVSASSNTSCSLSTPGSSSCWGVNFSGQLGDGTTTDRLTPVPVMGGQSFVQIVSAERHTCGLIGAGDAWCWGRDWTGSLGDGTGGINYTTPQAVVGGRRFVKLAVGFEHSCGLTTTGELYCWGDNQTGELGIGTSGLTTNPAPLLVSGGHAFADVAAAAWQTCGITRAADLYCWGHVDNAGTRQTVPTLEPGGLKWASISPHMNTQTHKVPAGGFNCGVTTGGQGYCWGANDRGQLGNPSLPTETPTTTPSPVAGGHTFIEITAGDGTACGLTTGGEVYCWGDNTFGALGDGSSVAFRTMPGKVPLPAPALSVSGGSSHQCAELVTGSVYCWGDNRVGNLGIGTNATQATPAPIQGGLTFASLAFGFPNCGFVGAQAYCWGDNPGDGTTVGADGPVAVLGGPFTTLFGGGPSTCARDFASGLWCWGSNAGVFGDGGLAPSLVPSAAALGEQYLHVSVTAGLLGRHACGITVSAIPKCWGANGLGQLGDGTGGSACGGNCDSQVPVTVVAAPGAFREVVVGPRVSCALTVNDEALCWGFVDPALPNMPAPVVGGLKFASLTVGNGFACGIQLGTSQAYCWGRNFTGSGLNPVAVAGGIAFTQLAAGDLHVCGMTATGAVYCWGDSTFGVIGDGNTSAGFVAAPVLLPGVTAIAVRAGGRASCVLTPGGTVMCWGDNRAGTLGPEPGNRQSKVPVLVL